MTASAGAPTDDANNRLSSIDIFKGVSSKDCKCVSQRLLLSNSPYAHQGCEASEPYCEVNNSRASPPGMLSEMLEPYDGKLSRTVLRGTLGS